MEWPAITAQEGLKRLKRGAKALDVRSPVEFSQGNIPGFANIPILNNEHRHEVGSTYKSQGQDAAIERGLELVTPLRGALVESWRDTLLPVSEEMRLLTCWRGGLRSKMAAQWLDESGFSGVRVAGGYKALRAELLSLLSHPPEFLVLGGLTGSGKTDLLQSLAHPSVLDLELYANHRGSSFGLRIDQVQPQQQTFENAIGLTLFEGPKLMVVEAESRMVGKCVVPEAVKAQMDRSKVIILECTQEERTQRIFAEYVKRPLAESSPNQVLAHLTGALKRVEKRLGGLRFQEIKRHLDAAFFYRELKIENHAPWIEALLREYYDPMYEFSFNDKKRDVLFRGSFKDVQDFLRQRLS